MSNRKLVALHRIEVADGTESRPKRVNGKTVTDEKGKIVMEEVVKTKAIPAGAVFVMDDASSDYKDLVALGAVRTAKDDETATLTLGDVAPAKAKAPKGKAPKAEAPAEDDDEGVI